MTAGPYPSTWLRGRGWATTVIRLFEAYPVATVFGVGLALRLFAVASLGDIVYDQGGDSVRYLFDRARHSRRPAVRDHGRRSDACAALPVLSRRAPVDLRRLAEERGAHTGRDRRGHSRRPDVDGPRRVGRSVELVCGATMGDVSAGDPQHRRRVSTDTSGVLVGYGVLAGRAGDRTSLVRALCGRRGLLERELPDTLGQPPVPADLCAGAVAFLVAAHRLESPLGRGRCGRHFRSGGRQRRLVDGARLHEDVSARASDFERA